MSNQEILEELYDQVYKSYIPDSGEFKEQKEAIIKKAIDAHKAGDDEKAWKQCVKVGELRINADPNEVGGFRSLLTNRGIEIVNEMMSNDDLIKEFGGAFTSEDRQRRKAARNFITSFMYCENTRELFETLVRKMYRMGLEIAIRTNDDKKEEADATAKGRPYGFPVFELASIKIIATRDKTKIPQRDKATQDKEMALLEASFLMASLGIVSRDQNPEQSDDPEKPGPDGMDFDIN